MRRSRYTVTVIDSNGNQSRRVVLAYSADGARQCYARRYWYSVVSVTKGDYRKVAAPTQPKQAQRFKVDASALRDACELLDIRLPVKVRTHSRVGGTLGNHRFPGEAWHNVMVKSYLSVVEANSVLWHELAHCMQSEKAVRAGKRWAAVSQAQRAYPYRIRPIEIEANALADRYKDISLVKAI